MSRNLKSFLVGAVLVGTILENTQISHAAAPFTFSTYFRGGTGSNLKGGQAECYSNPGSQGNEFRLGNECGIYAEASFISQLVDPANADGLSAQALFMFSYGYQNTTDFEVSTTPWVLRQAYVDLGSANDFAGKFWVGKRYYRWNDVHSDDFFPVAFNGPGAGWGGYKSSLGTWDVSVIQNSEGKEISGNGSHINTKAKEASKTTFHVRLDDMVLTEKNKLSFWVTYGNTPATKQTDLTFNTYKQGSGGFIAVKDIYTAEEFGNEFGVAFGNGVMSSMSSQGELVRDCTDATDAACKVMSSNRVRAWNAFTVQKQKWSGQLAAVYDEYDKNTSTDSKVQWTSISVQPVYYFTDHVQLTSVLGYSNVLDESDGHGNRTLTRFSVGPQLSLGRTYYSRPVLRALYTNTSWSSTNKSSFSTSSSVGKRNAQSLIAQVEVWF